MDRNYISLLGKLTQSFVALIATLGLFAVTPISVARDFPPEGNSSNKRVALVIGNAAYPGASALKNPTNDAKDIATKLKALGFDVTLKTDVPLRQMLRSLSEFGDKVVDGSEALFFYAGHGMQVHGKNYLIPVDAQINTASHVSSEAVDVDQLLDKLSRARLSMVVLDACRNNPFERRFRGGGQGLAQINAPTGTLIAYATAPGKVAADGDGRNGLYTQELLKAMDIPGIKVEDVFKQVRANVVQKSGEAQVPWESSSLTGDFYFILKVPTAVSVQLAPPFPVQQVSGMSGSETVELAFWDSIKDSKNKADFFAYLSKYPGGNFESLAKNRISELSAIEQSGSALPSHGEPDGIWRGRLETYGGWFDKPVQVNVEIRVRNRTLDGEVFMYGETRKFSGNVDELGNLSNAKLVGKVQSYDLRGTLPEIHGDGLMGWKLNITMRKEN